VKAVASRARPGDIRTEQQSRVQVATRRRSTAIQRKRRRVGFLFTLPVLLLVALLIALPLGQAGYYSFTDWNGLTSQFVGLQNYADNLFRNPGVERILLNNVFILASVPLVVLAGLGTAMLVFLGGPLASRFRSVYFLPTLLSWVTVGIMGQTLYSGSLPFFRNDWLAGSITALAALILTLSWAQFGLCATVLLAGLSTVDRSLIDAARLDGASWVTLTFRVIIPLMRRFIEFVLIVCMVASLTGIFALIYVMSQGGPGDATTTLEFSLYQNGFGNLYFGYAAATGVILLAITALITFPRVRAACRRDTSR
jgi:multiple sugar transport system permease protein